MGHYQHALPAGYTLQNYTVKSVLGQGGFGITYLAIDNYLNRLVAIKEYMPVEFVVREQSDGRVMLSEPRHEKLFNWGLDRFCREASTLAKFNHPHIVRLLHLFKKNQTAYIVMEYEQGRDLNSLIEAGKPLTEKQLLALAAPILNGLSQIHRKGFIHRDIKPGNIYIRENGQPVLIDFGSARCAKANSKQTVTCLVTHGYTPFEQYANPSDFQEGPWTDIYALAATLYHLISGAKPCDATTRASAILSGKPDPLKPLNGQAKLKHFSTRFLQAIDAGLNFKPEQRPQSARAWCAMLVGEAEAVSASALASAAALNPGKSLTRRNTYFPEAAGGKKRGLAPLAALMQSLRPAKPVRLSSVLSSLFILGAAIFAANFFYSPSFRNIVSAYFA